VPDPADLPRGAPAGFPMAALPGRDKPFLAYERRIVTVPAPRLLPEVLRRDPPGPPPAGGPLLLVTTGSLGPAPIAGAGEVL
jgi:hypothetical protein